MKSKQKPIRTMVSAAVATILVSSAVNAGGFSLYTEGSAAATGNFAAGIAAEGADASIGWYNPAGLVLIDQQQVVMSGIGIFPSSELSGTSTFRIRGLPPYTQSFTDLQAAKNAFVPAMHYAYPLGDRAGFGLSITSPFGLSTDYDIDSPVRYAATLSELITINISPELGGKLTDNFSVGLGLDLQWAQVKFNRVLGLAPLYQASGVDPSLLDSTSYNKGRSTGVGFHAGLLAMFNDNHTRLGVNYQSKMDHSFTGYSKLTGPFVTGDSADTNAVFRSDSLRSNDISLPDVTTLSAYQDVTNQLAVLGSVVYTGWDVFKKIQLFNVAASSLDGPVLVNSTAIQNYRNAWRFALGANYHVNDQWMLRAGGGYDQTPTVNAERDVRLPDADRWALSIGAHYQMRPSIGFDVGYTHLFADESRLNKTDPLGLTASYNVNARTKAHADLVGVQAVWTIDQPMVVSNK